jgi:hypothetical protein
MMLTVADPTATGAQRDENAGYCTVEGKFAFEPFLHRPRPCATSPCSFRREAALLGVAIRMLAPIGATSCTSTRVPSLLVISKPDAFGSTGPLKITCTMGKGAGTRALGAGSVIVAATARQEQQQATIRWR